MVLVVDSNMCKQKPTNNGENVLSEEAAPTK